MWKRDRTISLCLNYHGKTCFDSKVSNIRYGDELPVDRKKEGISGYYFVILMILKTIYTHITMFVEM